MIEIYKSLAFLVVGYFVSYISYIVNSTFITDFTDDFISLLTTLLAINIASSSLIAGKLIDINKLTDVKFKKTRVELKNGFCIQLVLIALAFISLLLTNSQLLEVKYGKTNILLASNTLTIAIFIYYLHILYDIGSALFSLLDFEENHKT